MSCTRLSATLLTVALLRGAGLAAQVPADTAQQRHQRTLDSLAILVGTLQARIDSLAARPGGDVPSPDLSVIGDIRTSVFNPGPQSDNFDARKFAVSVQSVLPAHASATVFASFERGQVGIEEGYLRFPALPGHLQVDIGRFRQDIGELNRSRLHTLPEDEYPLVVRRFASDGGLIGTGVSVYWPLPLPGKAGAYGLSVQGTTGSNSVLYAGGNRPAINSKVSGTWQLTHATSVTASASGAYGTNPDTGLTSSLAVLAARLTWRPPEEGGAGELTIRGEYWSLHRSFSGVATTRYGGYADAAWKLSRRYVLSARWDWLQAADPSVASHEWAITPSLTYRQSEFVLLRALYEHARDVSGILHDRLTMQAVFAMGRRDHELFQ